MGLVLSYIKNYKLEMLLTLLGSLAFVGVNLGLPMTVSKIINQAIANGETALLNRYIVQMIGMVVLSFLFLLGSRFGLSRLASGVTRDIRNDVYEKMLKLSHHEFQELGVPSMTNRITTDAFVILQFVQLIFGMGLTAPLMVVFSVVMITQTSLQLGAYVAPTVPIIFLIILYLARLTVPISTQQQTTLDDINRIQRENITGMRVIRGFNRQDYMQNKFERVNQDYRDISTHLFKIMAIPAPVAWLIIDTALVIVVWFGAAYIEGGSLMIGDLVAFIQYVTQALFSIMLFSNIFMMYPRAQVSANRLQEILETPISVANPENPITETDGSGTLEFRNVTFMYPDADEPVLKNISFKTKAGQTTAFIGSTGSGKSTIVKLIPRFYDVTSGQILLDGIDIRDLDLKVLREKVGYTPQKANLFTGEIAANLRFGFEQAAVHDMERATDVSQASEFIAKTEKGLRTYLSEGGSNLSGGQKQRLSIARSVIGDHEVYIFDDSFSALDYKTDVAVRSALSQEIGQATTLIVAQRVGTIMNADQIIVLDHGEVAAIGSHKELLETSNLYYEIAASQLSEEELNR
ncbi:ABC transporter ATP-binding protein [Hutsoniella sourekii]|uniref:ABC transporter ATP-binding protein n=1 Tax=Hutsoniella sourekii TaxID=87650 RepID=UPI000483E416|nr:ABC transporter ATP-binding protein [Hutsoniella sourekii]